MKRWEILILFIVLMLTIVSGLFDLETNPGFWFDEGIVAGVAKNIVQSGIYGTQTAPGEFHTSNYWISVNYPVVWPAALSIKIFGAGVWPVRLISLSYLVGFLVISYLFIRELFGRRTALWALVLLATFSPFYGNGRALLGEVPALFWLFLGMLAYLRFQKSSDRKQAYLASIFWGLAVATKLSFALFVPGFSYLIFILWRKREASSRTIALMFFCFGLPLLVWLYFAFDYSLILSLPNPLSYFFNAYASQSFLPLVVGNLRRFITESTPIHFAILSLIIILALIKFRGQNKEKLVSNPLLTSLALFFVLSFLWYLKTPGWYRYFFPIHLIALVFLPAALMFLIRRQGPIILFLSALAVFQAVHLGYSYKNLASGDSLTIGNFLNQQIGTGESVLVTSKPEVSYLLESSNLYQFIFINKQLVIGRNILEEKLTDYIVTGRRDDPFVLGSKELIESRYQLLREIGHYRVYKKQ